MALYPCKVLSRLDEGSKSVKKNLVGTGTGGCKSKFIY